MLLFSTTKSPLLISSATSLVEPGLIINLLYIVVSPVFNTLKLGFASSPPTFRVESICKSPAMSVLPSEYCTENFSVVLLYIINLSILPLTL